MGVLAGLMDRTPIPKTRGVAAQRLTKGVHVLLNAADQSADPRYLELPHRTLRNLRRAINDRGPSEQLLHGEPHPGNVLSTNNGPLFVDLETCCRGPVEFDLAHVPEKVSEHYGGIDQGLLRECRQLVLAMVAAWRRDTSDELPNGKRAGQELLSVLRDGPPWPTLDALTQ
jgi:hypothetical protein